MSTIAMKSTMEMNNIKTDENASVFTQFKNYIFENSAILAAGTAMSCGNTYAAAKIMIDSRK